MAKSDQPARLADRVVQDPANPPATMVLTGFLGKSSEKGHTRLYFDVELSRFIEIPDQDLLHSEPSDLRLHPHHVWVSRKAQVIRGDNRAEVALVDLFSAAAAPPRGVGACGLCACDTAFVAASAPPRGVGACGLCACDTAFRAAAAPPRGVGACGLCACDDA